MNLNRLTGQSGSRILSHGSNGHGTLTRAKRHRQAMDILRLAAVLAGLGVMWALFGCGPVISPQATAQISADYSQAKVDGQRATDAAALKSQQAKADADAAIAKAKADATLLAAKAEFSPMAHPIAASNYVIQKIRPYLIGLAIAFALAFAAGIILKGWFPSLGGSLMEDGLKGFLAFAGAAILSALFAPIIFIATGAFVAWFIALVIIDKGNVKEAATTIATDVGLETPATTVTTVTKTTVAAAPAPPIT
jgi:hypothetical protein